MNSPVMANAAKAPIADPTNAGRALAGSETRCGRYAVRSSERSTVSGTSATAIAEASSRTRKKTNGVVSGSAE